MNPRNPDSRPPRVLSDDLLDLIVRGVFAFTLAVSAAGADAADRRRDQLLQRQDPRLN